MEGNGLCSASPQDLPKPIRANFILNVETDELFITAGLQDRVVQVSGPGRSRSLLACPSELSSPPQVYEGLVYMDFSSALMDERGYGVKSLLSVSANLSFANVRALAFGGCSLRGLRAHGHERAPPLLAGVPERPQRLRTHPQQHQTALAQRYVLPSEHAVRRRRLCSARAGVLLMSAACVKAGLCFHRGTSGGGRDEDVRRAHRSSQVGPKTLARSWKSGS